MRDIDCTSWWDAGVVPCLRLIAYDVSYSSGIRRLTRNSEQDILEEYIDLDSIRFEWTQGTDFIPGGVIPAKLSVKILANNGVTITPKLTPTPRSYPRVYRMRLYYDYYNYIDFGGYFIPICKKSNNNINSTEYTFEDELKVLDYVEIDVASYNTSTMSDLVGIIMTQCGFDPSLIDRTEIQRGANYYTGAPMSARRALSLILQMHGRYVFQDNDYFYVDRINKNNVLDGTLDINYSSNYTFDDYSGRWYQGILNPSDDPIQYSGTDPETLLLQNNPFVVEGNKSTYQMFFNANINRIYRAGFKIKYRIHPGIQLGDYLKVPYRINKNTTSYRQMVVSRIVWEGGAFMTLEEATFDPTGGKA